MSRTLRARRGAVAAAEVGGVIGGRAVLATASGRFTSFAGAALPSAHATNAGYAAAAVMTETVLKQARD